MNWVKEAFKTCVPKPKGWLSIADIVAQTGNNRKLIAQRLRNMVEAGELEVMECVENGRRIKCYKKKNEK